MKKLNLIVLLALSVTFSCKKVNDYKSDMTSTKPEAKKPTSFNLNKDDYALYLKAIISHANNLDSLTAIFAAKSQADGRENLQTSTNKLKTTDVGDTSNDIPVSQDMVGSAGDGVDYSFPMTPDLSLSGQAAYYTDPHNVFISQIWMSCVFSMRGNTLNIRIPYSYDLNGGPFIDKGVRGAYGVTDATSSMTITGQSLGTFNTPIMSTNIYNPDYHQNPASGNSEGFIQETRVRSYTSDGHFKFSVDGKVVGAEVSAGVTIVSQYNSTSDYNYHATFTIKSPHNGIDFPQVNYNLAAVCVGIQSN